jgi:spore coat polysaccharide biosynthesis predicted glycosyltransferase SpsG
MSSFTFYAVAKHSVGLGQIKRAVTLARELIARGHIVRFATEHETPGLQILRQARMDVIDYHPLDFSWVTRGDVLVVDLKRGPGRTLLERVREHYRTVVSFGNVGYDMDDLDAVLELSDLVVAQSVIQDAAGDNILGGVEYVMLDPAYALAEPDPDGPIVVSFGGSDPEGVTQVAIDALDGIGRHVYIIAGAARQFADLKIYDGMQIIDSPSSLLPYLRGASAALISTGMTVYEALASGVPCAVVNWTDEHERAAMALPVINLGLAKNANAEVLRKGVEDALARFDELSAAGKALVDGQGVRRVADAIEGTLDEPLYVSDERMGLGVSITQPDTLTDADREGLRETARKWRGEAEDEPLDADRGKPDKRKRKKREPEADEDGP